MFKQLKSAVAMVLVLSMMLVGCATKAKTPEEIVLNAFNTLNVGKSISVGMTLDMGMKMTVAEQEPENVTLGMTGKIDLTAEPMKMKGDVNMTMTAQGATVSIPAQAYMETTETGAVFYAQYDGKWYKFAMNDPELQNNLSSSIGGGKEKALPETMTVELLGEEKVGEIDCYKIKVTDSDSSWMDSANNIQGYTFDTTNLPPLTYTLLIDKKTDEMLSLSTDVSTMVNNLMQQELKKQGLLEGNTVDITMTMKFDFSQLNKVTAITVPEEAKSAQEIKL